MRNTPCYVVMGVTTSGERDILGIWAGDGGEGVRFWLSVFTELKNRGVKDVLIAVCDGLTGLARHDYDHVGDESLEEADRRAIATALHRNNGYALRYEHASPHEHALLWVSDRSPGVHTKGRSVAPRPTNHRRNTTLKS